MMAILSSSKRRRGAPPGNQNALKHGFYAAHKPASAQSAENTPILDLQAEIDLIRQSMQRVLALGEPQTYREAVDYLRSLSLAATTLTRLARTHRYLYPAPNPGDELSLAITEALKEIGQEIEAGEFPSKNTSNNIQPRHRPRPRPPRRFHRRPPRVNTG
jgi:hypothetical protein